MSTYRLVFLVVVCALVFALLGCSGGSMTHQPKQFVYKNTDYPGNPAANRTQQGGLFSLVPMDDRGAKRPDLLPFFEVRPVEGKDKSTRVEIWARDFKDAGYVLFELNYDPGIYKPRNVEFTNFMGAPADVITIAITSYWKHVGVGIARLYYDTRPGISGSGLICTVVFDNTPFGPQRMAARDSGNLTNFAPTTVTNQAVLSNTSTGGVPQLSWNEMNVADGDNSGEVAVGDITPIALSFLLTIPNASKPWLYFVDYDASNEVAIGDITPIARFYMSNVIGYQVQQSPDGTTNWTPVTPGDVTVTRASVNANPVTQDARLHYVWTAPDVIQDTTYYRVIPVGLDPVAGGNDFGQASTVAQVDAVLPLQSVRIQLPADPTALPLIITEASIADPLAAEPFAKPTIQLQAFGIPIGSTNEMDVTDQVLWDIELHSATAKVGNVTGEKGLVTGLDRGIAVIRAVSALDFNVKATQIITVASIDQIALTSGGAPDPISLTPGSPVSFEATATFDDGVDPDPLTPVDETPPITGIDITPYVAWLEVHNTASPAIFTYAAGGTLLNDDPAIQPGDWVRAFCQLPGTAAPTIFFGYVATSNSIEVTFN